MTIVDLTKARAYAASIDSETSRDWITELADEVESLRRHADRLGRQIDAHIADLERARSENEQLHEGLEELYNQVAGMIAQSKSLP